VDRPLPFELRTDGPHLHGVVREEGLSEAEAWDRLRRVDRLRSAFLRELYGRDPADPTLYHLVFDTAVLPLDACLEAAAAGAVQP